MPSPNVIEIVSVNVARPSVLVRGPTKDVLSAIDKRPVTSSALQVTTTTSSEVFPSGTSSSNVMSNIQWAR